MEDRPTYYLYSLRRDELLCEYSFRFHNYSVQSQQKILSILNSYKIVESDIIEFRDKFLKIKSLECKCGSCKNKTTVFREDLIKGKYKCNICNTVQNIIYNDRNYKRPTNKFEFFDLPNVKANEVKRSYLIDLILLIVANLIFFARGYFYISELVLALIFIQLLLVFISILFAVKRKLNILKLTITVLMLMFVFCIFILFMGNANDIGYASMVLVFIIIGAYRKLKLLLYLFKTK